MPRASPTTTMRQACARSRVTNGKSLLPGIDGRSAVARRYQDLIASLTSDAGGEGQLSEARRQLIRRFAAHAVLAENIETRLAMGETIDLAEHCTISSTLVRLATRPGINRHAKVIVPPLRDYLESKAAPPAPPAEVAP
jgi:hypothetical protein